MNPNYPYTNTNTHTNVNTGLHTNVPVVGVVGQPGHQHVNTVPYGNVGTTGVNHPTTYTTTTTTHGTYTTHPAGYTQGQMYKWNNPYGLSIPVINFDANCKKCHGTGTAKSRFSGTPLPCPRCYTRQGYCKKCYGTGTHYRKNKPCNKCQAGRRMNNKSSSSSDSN